jgi:hypothetical protein
VGGGGGAPAAAAHTRRKTTKYRYAGLGCVGIANTPIRPHVSRPVLDSHNLDCPARDVLSESGHLEPGTGVGDILQAVLFFTIESPTLWDVQIKYQNGPPPRFH